MELLGDGEVATKVGATVSAAALPAPGGRLRGFKVLVVDDEADSRDLMVHYLTDFGCQVVTEADGRACLATARAHRPDLITLDLRMPGVSGWEVLTRLKDDPELRRIPVVVISIVAGEDRGRPTQAADLIPKPFERDDLLRVLLRNLPPGGEGHDVSAG